MRRRNAAGKLTALVWLRLPFLRNSSFLVRQIPISVGFPLTIAHFPPDPADFDAAPPVDMSKRRIRDRDRLPADEASMDRRPFTCASWDGSCTSRVVRAS
jgi:hypothetical protein